MYKLKYTILFLSTILLSCSEVSKEKIVENANNSLTIYNIDTKDKFYPSHIHSDKDRSSLFWEKPDGTILKISERKQEISALIFDKKRNAVIYSQSQYVSKIPKMLDPFIPNLPYRFSDYKILAYNLEKQSTKVLVDLPSQNIIGVVIRIGFLDNGKKIAFQTHYGDIYISEIDSPKEVVKFIPQVHFPNQLKFMGLWGMETDGNECIIFKAMSGFVSREDQTRVYNSYKYNIKTHQVIKTTNNPFFYGG